MEQIQVSAEVITAIIFGLLQLVIGVLSLWQQHRFRGANGMLPPIL
jgi:hypothetical protein